MISLLTKPISFQDYCQYSDDTTRRYEWIEGHLIPMTPPSFLHLLLGDRLMVLFNAAIQRQGRSLFCLKETGVRTSLQKSRIADLVIVDKAIILEALEQVAICEIPPLVVVEIVSPESRQRDYRYKRSEYAANEIPEYWIVDPDKGGVTILIFNQGLYDETYLTGNQPLQSPQFPDLGITVQQLFDFSNTV
jgi:Uma2 family endonuclease